MKAFSFLSLLMGILFVSYVAPALKPLPYLVYPVGADHVYVFTLVTGWASVLFGTYSVYSIFSAICYALDKRSQHSSFYKGGALYIKKRQPYQQRAVRNPASGSNYFMEGILELILILILKSIFLNFPRLVCPKIWEISCLLLWPPAEPMMWRSYPESC